jgi:hypothetical protein
MGRISKAAAAAAAVAAASSDPYGWIDDLLREGVAEVHSAIESGTVEVMLETLGGETDEPSEMLLEVSDDWLCDSICDSCVCVCMSSSAQPPSQYMPLCVIHACVCVYVCPALHSHRLSTCRCVTQLCTATVSAHAAA